MVNLYELKEIQQAATEVTNTVAELSKKLSEIAVRLHDVIEKEEEGGTA